MKTNAPNTCREQCASRQYRANLRLTTAAAAVFSVCAILLNASGIERSIELMKYGNFRDRALIVFRPVAGFSNRLGLTRFRTMIEQRIGRRMHNERVDR